MSEPPRLVWNTYKKGWVRATKPAVTLGKRGTFSHSQSRRVRRRVMDTDAAPAAKKAKSYEAQMIPGVDGRRIFGFPNSIITQLRYGTYMTLASGSGGRGVNVYSANSIFDVDVSGVGHQPMWRDNYANIYQNYVVLGSKITVTFLPVTGSLNCLYGIVADDDGNISTNIEALLEMSNSVSSCGGPIGTEPVTLTSTFSPIRDFGVEARDDGASATNNGSSPAQQNYWGVWAACMDGASTITTNLKIEIEYTVKFTELITQGLS